MFMPKLITAPADQLFTLDELKVHCRVDFDNDDEMLNALILAAQSFLDGYSGVLGRCLINQTWEQTFPGFNAVLRLPFGNVSEYSINYFDEVGDEQSLTAGTELLEDSLSSYVKFLPGVSYPSVSANRSDPVKIEFVSGYGDAATDIPSAILLVAKMLAAHWYENREAVAYTKFEEMPWACRSLISAYRVNIV